MSVWFLEFGMKTNSNKFFSNCPGRGFRVAVVDSGVHAAHPHVGGVSGGVAISADGSENDDYADRLGHGTAVTAVVREKAPSAELFGVKVFERTLSTQIGTLVQAIDWSAQHQMQLINLSLGTAKAEYENRLGLAVAQAAKKGAWIVAAFEDAGVRWLPGSLPDVIPVLLDWDCPREEHRADLMQDGRVIFRASGFPRSIPGVPPERNLKGISFAVANMTGFAARALEAYPGASLRDLLEILTN